MTSDSCTPAERFPLTVSDKGRTFARTGKVGRNLPTGQDAAEFEADDASRVWANEAGEILTRNA